MKQRHPSLHEVQDAVIPEMVDTIWSSVYREVAIGTLQIEDLDFNRTPIEDRSVEGQHRIRGARIRPSAEHTQTVASLSYDFQVTATPVHISATDSDTLYPIDRIRRTDAAYPW